MIDFSIVFYLLFKSLVLLLQFLNCCKDILDFYKILDVELYFFYFFHEVGLDLDVHFDDSGNEITFLITLQQKEDRYFNHLFYGLML